MKRLKNPHFGQWIDPSQTVQFTFEGELIQGFEGDTVASALLANDQWVQSRSFKYHRPRGPLTLCGYDANTLVQTPVTPNLLADRLPAKDHLAVTAQNYTGSLHFDLSRLLDWFGRFLPVGFYYKAFFKPRAFGPGGNLLLGRLRDWVLVTSRLKQPTTTKPTRLLTLPSLVRDLRV